MFTSVSKSKKIVVTVFAAERAERDRLAIARALLCGELMRIEHWRMLPLKRRRKGGVSFADEYDMKRAGEMDDEEDTYGMASIASSAAFDTTISANGEKLRRGSFSPPFATLRASTPGFKQLRTMSTS